MRGEKAQQSDERSNGNLCFVYVLFVYAPIRYSTSISGMGNGSPPQANGRHTYE